MKIDLADYLDKPHELRHSDNKGTIVAVFRRPAPFNKDWPFGVVTEYRTNGVSGHLVTLHASDGTFGIYPTGSEVVLQPQNN